MLPKTTPMPGGRPCLPPLGWIYLFGKCRHLFGVAEKSVVVLTEPLLEEMVAVNRQVDVEIKYVRSPARTEKGYLAQEEGDCRAFAFQKQRRLVERGWQHGALRLSTCRTEHGVHHVLLTVETDRGTWLLDNHQIGVHAWTDPKYRWLKREVPGRFMWERIGD